jgi:predicted component of type VI protein secretion system
VSSDAASDPFANPRTALASLQSMPPAQAASAIAQLCGDLARHDAALLEAMQAAFHHALEQFSPDAIKQRHRGDAEAWKAYERGFAGPEGFVETFSKAFAAAYAKTTGQP